MALHPVIQTQAAFYSVAPLFLKGFIILAEPSCALRAGDDGEAEPGSLPPASLPALLTASKPVTWRRRPRHKDRGWGRPGAEAASWGRCEPKRHASLYWLPAAGEEPERPPQPPCASPRACCSPLGAPQVRTDPDPGRQKLQPPQTRGAAPGAEAELPGTGGRLGSAAFARRGIEGSADHGGKRSRRRWALRPRNLGELTQSFSVVSEPLKF